MNTTETTTTTAPRKWAADTTNPPGKIQVNAVNGALGKLRMAHNDRKEISGVIGGQEHTSCFNELFGVHRREDVAAVQKAIGEKYNWTVSKANAAQIRTEIEAALPELSRNMPVVDNRITAEQDTENQAERQKAEADRAEKSRLAGIETDRIAAELRAKYPWALPADAMRGGPRAAANCKSELVQKWPYARFSVRSDHNSMRVSWLNGPTEKQVREIVGKYQDGHFDGMTDSHEYDRSNYGTAVDRVLGRVTYTSVSRGYGENHETMKIQNDVARWILALEEIPATEELWNCRLPRFENGSYMGATTAARQVMDATELPPGAKIVGVVWNKEVEGGLNVPENWYKLVLEVPERSAVQADGGQDGQAGTTGTVRRNLELGGVEVSFPAKPEREIIDRLKANGFRWSMRSKVWYKKFSEGAWSVACLIAGVLANPEDESHGPACAQRLHGAAECDCGKADATASYAQAQEDAFLDRQAEAIGA